MTPVPGAAQRRRGVAVTSGLRVRPARTSDMRAIRALVSPRRAPDPAPEGSGGHHYEATGDFVVAELDDRIVGCGAVHVLWEDLAEIRTLVVTDEASVAGVGTAIPRRPRRARPWSRGAAALLPDLRDRVLSSGGFEAIEGRRLPRCMPSCCGPMTRESPSSSTSNASASNTLGNTRMLRVL